MDIGAGGAEVGFVSERGPKLVNVNAGGVILVSRLAHICLLNVWYNGGA